MWDDPDDFSIQGWQYNYKLSGGVYSEQWQNMPASDAKTTSHTVTGLTNGATHIFKIRAVNNVNGYESDERAATPKSLRPAKPTGLTATPGDGQVLLQWENSDDPTVTGWQYSAGTAGRFGRWMDIAGSSAATTAHRITGLANGITHVFKVRAVNASGPGPASDEATATPLALPEKPNGLTATPGDGQVLLQWENPDDPTITSWQYSVGTAGRFGPWTDIAGSNAATTAQRITGLANGTAHVFKLRAVNASGLGAESDEVTAKPLALPEKPTGLTATPGDGQVLLKWADLGDPTVTVWQYSIGTAEGFGAWTDIAGSNAATTAHQVTGLANGTAHVFKLRAVNASGPGAESDGVTATPLALPAKPAGLTATPGDGQVLLKWANLGDPTVTVWQYSVGTAGNFGPWMDIAGSNAATTRHQVSGLANGTTHVFKVRAVNAGGPGPASDEATATPLALPEKPTGLTATPGDGQVLLQWANPDDPTITGWQYSVGTAGRFGRWMDIAGSNAATTRHRITGLANGTTHVFKIRAVNASGNGDESDEVTAKLVALPAKPTGLTATPGDGQVLLQWSNPDDPTITGWQYSVGTAGRFGRWMDIAGSNAATTRHRITGLANGATHAFKVRAVNASGPGAESDEATATPLALPAKPTGLTATPGDGQVLLKWAGLGDPTVTVWQYSVGTAGRFGPWTDIAGSSAATTKHQVFGLANGTIHAFKLRAVNASGPGPASDEATATPLALPEKPNGLTATPGDGQVLLQWANPDDPTITVWQYSTGTAGRFGPWTDIAGSNAATTRHRITGLANGTTHVFKLRAVNASGPGPASDGVTATPLALPARPIGLTATPGDGQVLLQWENPNDPTITGWQYSAGTTGGDGLWTDIPGSGPATVGHAVTGLVNGSQYSFRVRAANNSGPGAASDEATATPLAAPVKSTGLTATPGNRQVQLEWNDLNDPTVIGWEYNQRQSGGAYAEYWTYILGSSAGTVAHTVTGLENGTSYGFRVRAVNAAGPGAESDEAVAFLPAVPAQPQGLTAAPGDGQVRLEWAASGDPTITGWQYRAGATDGDGPWTDIPGSGPETVRHTVTGLTNGTEYGFRVRAANSSGPGAASGEAFATPLAAPAKPTGFAATPGNGQALLEWNNPQDPTITGWQYNRRLSNGEYAAHWTHILGSSAETVAHTVTGLENGTSYGFRVRAVNAAGPGAESDEAVVFLPAVPAQPQGLTAAPGDGQVLLEWKNLEDSTVTAWQYRAGTAEGDSPWTDIPGSGPETVRYTVTGLVNGTEYGFRVRAANSSGPGAASGEAFATPFAAPAKPTGFAATPGIGQALLEWDDPKDPAITGWEYNQRQSGGEYEAYWTYILGSGAETVAHTVTGLENGASYGFKIRAVANDRISPESDEVVVLLPAVPPQPQGLTAAPGDGQVLLEWKNLEDPTVTVWQYRAGTTHGDGPWTDIPGSGAGTVAYAVTGLVNGTKYGFRIRAVNADGHSAESDEVFATPFAVPAKPAGLTAAPGDGLVQLEWDQLNDPTVTGWEYTQRQSGGAYEAYWTYILGSGAATTRYTVIGLDNDMPHGFMVRAVAGNRIGPASDEVTATPRAGLPAAPQGLAATPGDRQVLLRWLDPKNAAITGWQYRYRTTGGFGGWIDMAGAGAGTTGYAAAGLVNGVAHVFQIRARTAVGAGPPSAPTAPVRPAAELAGPTGLKALPGDGQVRLLWDERQNPAGTRWQYGVWEMTGNGPVDMIGGIAIGGRSLNPCERPPWTDIPGSDAATAQYTVSGLTNGITYAFQVRTSFDGKCSAGSNVVYATPAAAADKRERGMIKTVLANLAGQIAASAEAAVATRLAAAPAAARIAVAGHEVRALAPAARQPEAGHAPIGRTRAASGRMSASDLLRGSAVQIPLGRPGQEDGLHWTAWQRGDLRAFQGSAGPESLYGGALLSGWLGVDARLGRQWLIGAALARSEGEVDYAAGPAAGVIDTALNSIHPYMQWRFEDGATIWTTLGVGRGAIENIAADRDREKADIRMTTISAGFRSPLPTLGSLTLSASGAAGFAQIETDGDAQTTVGAVSSAADRQSVRLDAALEAGRTAPYLSAAARRDGGGGAAGAGLELAGGLRLALPSSSTHVDIRARWLAWHSDRDYREYGFSAAARRLADGDGRGPSWSLTAASGMPDSTGGGAEELWRGEASESGGGDASSLSARFGWGFASDAGIVTPYADLAVAAGKDRHVSFGITAGAPHGLLLDIAAERRLPRAGAAENRVTARLKLDF